MKQDEVFRSPDTLRGSRIPPGQKSTNEWPVLHYGSIPQIETTAWTFTIRGQVETERILSYDEFVALPRVKVLSDMHCVTRWSRLDNLWEGVSTSVIVELAKPLPEAKFVTVLSAGGFTTNLSTADFLQPDNLFALKHDGNTLTPQHGYPVRLVAPKLYLWKSAKWVSGIEFMQEDKPGFWESRGYHNRGDPWKEERYAP